MRVFPLCRPCPVELTTESLHATDALVGLRELLTSYPGLAYSSISTLLPLLARSIGDESPSFRTALLAFLDVYLRALPAVSLAVSRRRRTVSC